MLGVGWRDGVCAASRRRCRMGICVAIGEPVNASFPVQYFKMSDSGDALETLGYWRDLMNTRNGYSSWFAKGSAEDQTIVEISTTRDWAEAVLDKYGLQIQNIRSNPFRNGVPDCFASLNSDAIEIELTELVDEQLLTRIQSEEEADLRLSPFHGEGFDLAYWSKDRFLEELKKCIDKKELKYSARGIVVDFLIVHTDMNWLLPHEVELWLADHNCKQRVVDTWSILTYDLLSRIL